MGYTHSPGCVADPEKIEEIANETYNKLNSFFVDELGSGDYFRLVWGIGGLDEEKELLKQATRIKPIPTLHHLNNYDLIVKVGEYLDSSNESGIHKV